MAEIHPTAIIEGNVNLANDVVVGPHCVLQGDISIGEGTTLVGSCYLTGTLVIGTSNVVYPCSCIGFAGQDVNYTHDQYDPGIAIGNNNTFRENVTVHRATQEKPTTIGNDNMFMTTAHVGHDCQIGNSVTMVTDSMLGGHSHIHDNVIVSGGAGVHQFCTIGKGAMLAGCMMTTYDVPPYFMLTGNNVIGSVNIIGMRRSDMDKSEITRRKDIFKLFYRSGNTISASVEQLKEDGDPIALEYVTFIENSRRGLVLPEHPMRSERRGVTKSNA